jgi:hypothetical protein
MDPTANHRDEDPLAHIVIPDDARELEPDRQAWLLEEVQRRQHERRVVRERRGRMFDHIGPTVMASLMVVAVIVGLGMLVSSAQQLQTRSVPLASVSAAQTGRAGGLLPDVQVAVGARTVSAQSLRPAVIVIPPTGGCGTDCVAQITAASKAASQYPLPMFLVATPTTAESLDTVASAATSNRAVVITDIEGTLMSTFGSDKTTLVLVHSDGVIESVLQVPQSALQLGDPFSLLGSPGA